MLKTTNYDRQPLRRAVLAAALIVAPLALTGCGTTSTQRGASGGAAAGAAAGAIIGSTSGNAVGGALVGGAVGAAGGALIGNTVGRSHRGEKGHYERRTVTRPNGDTYREEVWVRDGR